MLNSLTAVTISHVSKHHVEHLSIHTWVVDYTSWGGKWWTQDAAWHSVEIHTAKLLLRCVEWTGGLAITVLSPFLCHNIVAWMDFSGTKLGCYSSPSTCAAHSLKCCSDPRAAPHHAPTPAHPSAFSPQGLCLHLFLLLQFCPSQAPQTWFLASFHSCANSILALLWSSCISQDESFMGTTLLNTVQDLRTNCYEMIA